MKEVQWVLEWSGKQNSFHIQPLEKALAVNQIRFINGTSSDWVVLMVGLKETCHSMADTHRDRLIQREQMEVA